MSYIINGIKYNAVFPPDESPNPLNVPSSYVFADETARDAYFTINFADLVKDETYIYIENTSDLQSWSGDTEPVSYVPNWASKIGFIKGDKGDSGSVGQGVNTGGATNQVLKKLSPANYDTDWGNITNAPNNSILIASGGDLADSGKRFNDLGITVADIWSANKVISQIDSQVAKTLSIEGNWNASTNTPNLDGILEGDTYIVEVAGINYGDTYEVNDWIVKTDTGYAKINNNLATVVFSAIGGSPLDNPALVLEFDKYINKISTISTGNIPKITADGQIEDSTYSVSDLFTKDLTDYTEKTTTLSNNDKVLVFDESTGLWKYSRIDRIPSSNSSTLKVSDTDTIEGYLIDKLIGTTNYIILTKVNAGAEEQIQIEIGSNVFDKSTNTTDDLTEGTTNLLLTQTERTLIGVLVNNGDGLSYLTNDGTYKRVSWGDIDGILSNQTDLQGALNLKEDIANKNKANGYVGLDANAKIDISYIPNSALERLIIVADETARFALTPTTAQNGDVVKQQDTDIMFYIVDDTNLSNSSGYEEFAVGTAGAVEWSNILNKPIDIFHTGTNTTDDITEGNTNLFDKEVVFTGGNNVTITGAYPNFEIQDNTMSQTDIQNALDDKLKSADNLTDVADQQTALNNITAVSGATDEYVLTKDTTTGNAQWKVSSDELTKVSANDTTTGYLEDKIVGTTNKITVTTLDDGNNEDLQIDIGTDIFDKSINTMDDVTDGTTYVKTENNLTDTLKTNYNSAYIHSTTTTGNPHSVTKTDVGLGNVVNVDTSNPANITWTESYRTVTDTEKTTWNGKVSSSDVVTTATANKILKLDENAKLPASITGNADGNSATATKLQTARTINGVGFDGSENITINAVDSTSRIASTEKGAVNGVATLDGTGKVPSSQLPSYVDDVLEYANYAEFPATGEVGKIYIDLATNKCYRWGGSAYVYITSGAVDTVNGKTGVVTLTKSDVGLENVTNNAQVKKIASSTDNAIVRWDGTTGDLPQNSLATISDTGTVNIPTGQNYNINGVALKDVSETLTNKTLTSPVLNTEATGTAITTTGEASKLVKTASVGTINMTQSVDGFSGIDINNTSAGLNAYCGYRAKSNNDSNLIMHNHSSERITTLFGNVVANKSTIYSRGADDTGILFGTLSASPLVIGTNGVERYNINSNGIHTFKTPATTSYNAIFRNTSYAGTDTSGTSSIKLGYLDHDGVKIEAYKDTAFNTSGIKFYGEYGIGNEKLLLNLKSSDDSANFSGNVIVNNGTGNNALLGLASNAGVLSLRDSSSAENIRLDSSTAKVTIGNATSTELNALTWQTSRLNVYDSIGIQNNATLAKSVFFTVGSAVDPSSMINLVRQSGDTIFKQGVRSDGNAMVFGDSSIERFSINRQKFIDYIEEGINGKLYVGRYNGIATSPTAIVSGDIVGTFGTKGQYGTTKYNYAIGGVISFVAAGNYVSATNAPTDLVVSLTTTTTFGAEKLRLTSTGNLSVSGYISNVRGANVASATTITPSGQIFHLTGTTEISTINIPYAGFNGTITIIPDGAFTTTTAGNIALETTAVANRALTMTYDSTTSKWYPSY